MIQPWVIMVVAILYVSILFAVASFGDRMRIYRDRTIVSKPNTYALSLAVYCTSWTFFGSVGLASSSGLSFLAIYAGPVLAVTIGFPLLRRIAKLSRQERITSVSDFLGARFGKNNKVAATAAIIAVFGTIPYIALQLKAISSSVDTLITEFTNGFPYGNASFGNLTFVVALVLAIFAVLFGTRHADATEHQDGLMLAIALESVIKLVAFLSVGIFVTWFMFDGISDIFQRASANANVQNIVRQGLNTGNFLILTFLSLIVFLLLPRQFHVAVVENHSDAELRRARWLFPLYLAAINLFVIPIAIAGTLRFGIVANADDYVLLLPLLENERALGLLVFLGGLSAGTAMVIVASVALAIMISNDLVLPAILRSGAAGFKSVPFNMEKLILNIRRTAIFVVLGLAYVYFTAADNSAALASIGLVSFAAIAQLAPAFFIGLFWRRANARGAIMGMLAGFSVWAYCLLLPTLFTENSDFVKNGLFSIAILKPENLFESNLNPISNGVIWSLLFNTGFFIFGSLSRQIDVQENLQAARFVNFQEMNKGFPDAVSANLPVSSLKQTLSRYLGQERTDRAFRVYAENKSYPDVVSGLVNEDLLHFSEHLLASAVGASSSRLIHTLMIQRYTRNSPHDIHLLDEASRAIMFNRDMLQTAFEQIEQGITVFDKNFHLASWNRKFRNILNLPDQIGQAGLPIVEVANAIVKANRLPNRVLNGDKLAQRLIKQQASWQLELSHPNRVVEINSSAMLEGGLVITWHDITQHVRAAEALVEANEMLEKRVEERTRELEEAKLSADRANASKTRFLAAAGHDILQPLNAARLYSATLSERLCKSQYRDLSENIGKSLGSVEEILGSILAISRLDSASPEVDFSNFPLYRITEQLEIEFEPIAEKQGLDLRFVHSSKWIRSDPTLLRRLLQNLISNAIKFTTDGKVLIGARLRKKTISLQIYDTGIGMEKEDQKIIFTEFTRLNDMGNHVPGLGLGLSIVERISGLLEHPVELASRRGVGTRFSVHLGCVPAQDAMVSSAPPIRKNPISRLAGMRVLCVDNDADILAGMEALLNQWGCEVYQASDFDSAQSVAGAANMDVLLLDYHLDHETGIAIYDQIRKLHRGGIGILITADHTDAVKKEAAAAGMALLNKPVKPAALRALLSQVQIGNQAAE